MREQNITGCGFSKHKRIYDESYLTTISIRPTVCLQKVIEQFTKNQDSHDHSADQASMMEIFRWKNILL